MVRRYRYITWHSGNETWFVQRRGYPSPGSAKTQLGVAKLAAARWGVSVSSLRLKRGRGREKAKPGKRSRYALVYWHVGRQTWYAQAKAAHGGYLGHYESEEAAAKAVVHAGLAKSLGELCRWRRKDRQLQRKTPLSLVSSLPRSGSWSYGRLTALPTDPRLRDCPET